MRNIHFIFCLLGLMAMLSCKKDETQAVAGDGIAAVLHAENPKAVVFNAETADQDSLTFAWQAADYGYAASINYTLQFALAADTAFASPVEVSFTSTTAYTVSGSAMNSLLGRLGIAADSKEAVNYRVISTLTEQYGRLVSAPMQVEVTLYSTEVVYPKLFVVGSHQGWAPSTAPALYDLSFKKIYTGYVNFPNATDEFKLTTVPSWDEPDYGSTAPGSLTLSGGSNIATSGAGYYLMTADLNTLSWKKEIMKFAVVGDAIGSWDVDRFLNYDAASNSLTLTAALSVGEIKFRANAAWTVSLGASGAENTLAFGGDNIAVSEAGTYLIRLDLSNPGNMVYSLEKQ